MPLSAVFKLFFVPQELQKVKMPTYTAADAERRRADVRRSFREVAVSMPEEREELWQLPADAPEALKALRGTYYLNGYWVAMLAFQTRSLTNVSVLSCCSKFPHKKSRFILELVYSYSCIVKLIWWKLLVCVHFISVSFEQVYMWGLASCDQGGRLVHPFEAHGFIRSFQFHGDGRNLMHSPWMFFLDPLMVGVVFLHVIPGSYNGSFEAPSPIEGVLWKHHVLPWREQQDVLCLEDLWTSNSSLQNVPSIFRLVNASISCCWIFLKRLGVFSNVVDFDLPLGLLNVPLAQMWTISNVTWE